MEIPRSLRLVLAFWQAERGMFVVRLLREAANPKWLGGAVMYHELLIMHAAQRKHLLSKCSSTVTAFRSWVKAKAGRTKNICPISRRRNLGLVVMDSP